MRLIDYDRLEEYAMEYQERNPRNPLTRGDFKLIDNFLFECTLMKDISITPTAQEPRVMTWQDVIGAAIECKPLYIEVKDSEDKEPGDDRWAMVTQYKDSITNGMIRAMSSYVTSEILFAEDYGKTWRVWTSQPTAEQMEVTSWK